MEKEFKAAAFLADGQKWNENDNFDIEKIINHLIQQKISLFYLDMKEWKSVEKNNLFNEHFQSEKNLFQKRYVEYLKLIEKFEEAGASLILFKSDGKFTYRGSDLDAMVKSQDTIRIKKIMSDSGYYELPMRIGSEPAKLAHRRVYPHDEFYDIEFYQNIVWYVHFADANKLFQRSQVSNEDENIYILSTEDRFISTLAHSIYQQKSFLLSDLVHLRKSFRGYDPDIDYAYTVVNRKGWLHGFKWGIRTVTNLEEEIWGESILQTAWHDNNLFSSRFNNNYFKIPSSTTRTFFIFKIFSDHDRNTFQKCFDLFRIVKKFIDSRISGQRRKLFITFSGIDGAGKSSLINYVNELFNKQEFPTPKTIWTRIDSNELFITNTLYKLFRPFIIRNVKLNEVPITQKKGIIKKNALIKLAWVYLNTIELIFHSNFRIRLPLIFQYSIIGDRYYHDAIVDIVTQLPDNDINGRIVRWLLQTFLPKPDLLFYLDVDPQIAFARKAHDKNKVTLEMLKKRSFLYEKLFAETSSNRIILLKTEKSIHLSKQIIKNEVLKLYFNK